MFGERLKRYSGLIQLITGLVIFIIVVVAGGAYIDSTRIQRETFARAKTINYDDMLHRFGVQDQSLREDLHKHLLMFRDGGRLTTRYGSNWDYPPVKTQYFLDALAPVLKAYDDEDWDAFVPAFEAFDKTYGVMITDRQRIYVAAQYVAAAIMFLGFIGILAMLFFRLGKADDEALAIRRENEHILASTNEGVFLIDKDYQIGAQQSNAVTDIFGQNIKVSGHFIDFIEGFVTKEDLERTEKFLRLVFGGRVKPRLMGDLNPLQNVEMTAERKNGGAIRRILNFDFSRNEQSDGVDNLLVTVSDVTKEALLREELESIQKTQDERLSLLRGLLHVDPAELREFFNKGSSSYKTMNELLEGGSLDPDGNVENLQEIGRIAHRLKGDAAALKLELFESSLHRFEDTLSELQAMNLVDGQSLIKLVVQLKNMIAEMDLAISLTNQFGAQAIVEPSEGDSSNDDVLKPSHSFSQKLSDLATRVSIRNGKQVNFSISGAQHLDELGDASNELYEIAVQLVRNALVHGIEAPEDRVAQQKPAYGKLHIALEKRPDKLTMNVTDDGHGIQFERIKAKALEQGLISASDAELANNKILLKLLFSHGFTSAQEVSEDAGRGVGLDAVRKMIEELQGSVTVGTEDGKHTRFKVSIPTHNKA